MKQIIKVYKQSYPTMEKELVETKSFKTKISAEDYVFNTYSDDEINSWTMREEIELSSRNNLIRTNVHQIILNK